MPNSVDTANSIGRLQGLALPPSEEFERVVLGSLLSKPQLFAQAGCLRAEHFSTPLHVELFAAMKRIHDEGNLVNEMTVLENLPSTLLRTPDNVRTQLLDLQYGLMERDVLCTVSVSSHRNCGYTWPSGFAKTATRFSGPIIQSSTGRPGLLHSPRPTGRPRR